tara:strand:+ start:1242 stop:1952 length:711 start_codon:yes stop_codon:yes gene_type:complete
MAPLRSLANTNSIFDDFYARTGKDAVGSPPPPVPPNDFDGTGAVYAFSGNNTTDDATGNENSISNYWQFSTTQKKWSDYTHSIQTNATWGTRIELPTWTPSASGWSFEFWVYPTAFAGKYLLHFGSGSLSINVQSGEFRFYRSFSGSQQNWSVTTSTLLNQWNFFQIFYDTSNTKFRINGTERASISGNTGTPGQVVLAAKTSSEGHDMSGFFQDIVFYNGVNRGAQSVPSTPFGH